MLKHATLVGVFILLFYVIKDYSKKLEPEPIVEDEVLEIKPTKKVKRFPASISKSAPKTTQLLKPQYKETKKEESNFSEEIQRTEVEEENIGGPAHPQPIYGQSFGTRSISYHKNSSTGESKPSSFERGSSTSGQSQILIGGGLVGGVGGEGTGTTTGGDSGSGSHSGSSGSGSNSGGGSAGDSLTCSADQGGGTFANPILVALQCSSSSSTIRYCLGQSGCCDPLTGSVYSSKVLVGMTDGTYCLSFMGETSDGTESTTTELNFTITSGTPHLQASHPKTYYQTTELTGLSYLASNDFGRSSYEMGQVNLKTHDPGPSGLNLGCKDMLENYVLYPPVTPTPAPNMILTINDLSTVNPGSQIEVPLAPADLSYGDNFIMSFVVDNTEATPEYACSTQKVVLNDFDYFEAYIAHGVAGTTNVREFSAGFSPYGFFEAESDIYRGPAGVSGHDQDGQRLESGLFEVFY